MSEALLQLMVVTVSPATAAKAHHDSLCCINL